MAADKPLAIFLMGPTASGKTALAMALRDHLPVELISVDSALVYRGMDIGSAKPTAAEQAKAPHRLIDIRDPAENYTAADFCADAKQEMAAIHRAGRIPLLVGGTMMYFRALLDGLHDLPSTDPEIRQAIEAQAEREGWPKIHELLAQVDPESAAAIHPNHSQRLSRALEVYRSSGRTMSAWRREPSEPGIGEDYQLAQLAIAPRQKHLLHERIATRFEQMLSEGVVAEVEKLVARPDLSPELPAMRAVGYRQLWNYCQGHCSLEQAREDALVATRRLAKRQLTWLRGWREPLYWLHTEDEQGQALTAQKIIAEAMRFLGEYAV